MKSGSKILISSIAEDVEKFKNAIKFLIDSNYINDIEFTSDYLYIRKMWKV